MGTYHTYATFDDIQNDLPIFLSDRLLSDDVIITEDNVNSYLEEISAEMDNRFEDVGYRDLITQAQTNERLKLTLRRICSNGGCMKVAKALADDENTSVLNLYDTFRTSYYADLARIERHGFPADVVRDPNYQTLLKRRAPYSPPYVSPFEENNDYSDYRR